MRKNRDSRRPKNRKLKHGCLGDKSREASFSCHYIKNIILVKLSTLFIKVSKQKTVHAFQRRMTFERRDIAVDAIDVKLHLLYFLLFCLYFVSIFSSFGFV